MVDATSKLMERALSMRPLIPRCKGKTSYRFESCPDYKKVKIMKRLSNKVKYSETVLDNFSTLNHKGDRDFMDAECVELCDALNSMKGITTNESCCGHNYKPYNIFFTCDSLEPLKFIQSCIDRRYWEFGDEWSIETYISDTEPFLMFVLTSKSTDLNNTIMPQVKSMIECFNHYLNHENRFKLLGQKYENFIFNEVE